MELNLSYADGAPDVSGCTMDPSVDMAVSSDLSRPAFFPSYGINGHGLSKEGVLRLYNTLLSNSREYEIREAINSGFLEVRETIVKNLCGYTAHRLDFISTGDGEKKYLENSIYLLFDEDGIESSIPASELAELSREGCGFYNFKASDFVSGFNSRAMDTQDVTAQYARYLDTKTLTPLALLYEYAGDMKTDFGEPVSEAERHAFFDSVIGQLNEGFDVSAPDDDLLNTVAVKCAPKHVQDYVSNAFTKNTTDGIYLSLMLSSKEFNSHNGTNLSLYDIGKTFWENIMTESDKCDEPEMASVDCSSSDCKSSIGSKIEDVISKVPFSGEKSIFSGSGSFGASCEGTFYLNNLLFKTIALVGAGLVVSGCSGLGNPMGEVFEEENKNFGKNTNPQDEIAETFELLEKDFNEHYTAEGGDITPVAKDLAIRKLPIGECTAGGNCLDSQFKVIEHSDGTREVIGCGENNLGDWEILRKGKSGDLYLGKFGESKLNDAILGNSPGDKEIAAALFESGGHPHAVVLFSEEWIKDPPIHSVRGVDVYDSWSIERVNCDHKLATDGHLSRREGNPVPLDIVDFPVIGVGDDQMPIILLNLSEFGRYSDTFLIRPVEDDNPSIAIFNESGLVELNG